MYLELGPNGERLKFTEERKFLNGQVVGERQGKLRDGKIHVKAGFSKSSIFKFFMENFNPVKGDVGESSR